MRVVVGWAVMGMLCTGCVPLVSTSKVQMMNGSFAELAAAVAAAPGLPAPTYLNTTTGSQRAALREKEPCSNATSSQKHSTTYWQLQQPSYTHFHQHTSATFEAL